MELIKLNQGLPPWLKVICVLINNFGGTNRLIKLN